MRRITAVTFFLVMSVANAPVTQPAENASLSSPDKVLQQEHQKHILVIPSGTKILLAMESSLNSCSLKAGDEFRATLCKSLLCDGIEAVPKGAEIEGQIFIPRSTHPLEMSVKFGTIKLPENMQFLFMAKFLTNNGFLTVHRGKCHFPIRVRRCRPPAFIDTSVTGVLSRKKVKVTNTSSMRDFVELQLLCGRAKHPFDLRPGDVLATQLIGDLHLPVTNPSEN